MRTLQLGLIALSIALAGLFGLVPTLAARPMAVNPLFASLLPALHRTGVPVLLPSAATMHTGRAEMVTSRTGVYEISIGYTADCKGSTACDIGTLHAQKLSKSSRPITVMRGGSTVHLAHGFLGYFRPYTCGASCGSSQLTFDRKGYRYDFYMKAATKAELVKVTNSAIVAGPS